MLYLADLEEVSVLTRKEKSIYVWSILVTEGLQPASAHHYATHVHWNFSHKDLQNKL